MLDAQDLPDSIAGRADVLPPAGLGRLVHGGGLDAARVHVAGALDIATGAQLEREPAFDDRVLHLSGAMVVAVLIAAAIVDEKRRGRLRRSAGLAPCHGPGRRLHREPWPGEVLQPRPV